MFTVVISEDGASFSLIYEDERTRVVVTSDIDVVGDILIKSDKGEWFTRFHNGWLELTWDNDYVRYVISLYGTAQHTAIKMTPELKNSLMNAMEIINKAITARCQHTELFG